MLCCILENAIENIYFFCFFFHIFSFSKLICNKKKKRLKNHNWGSVVGVVVGWQIVEGEWWWFG